MNCCIEDVNCDYRLTGKNSEHSCFTIHTRNRTIQLRLPQFIRSIRQFMQAIIKFDLPEHYAPQTI